MRESELVCLELSAPVVQTGCFASAGGVLVLVNCQSKHQRQVVARYGNDLLAPITQVASGTTTDSSENDALDILLT